jgi:lipopolysaccharide transport system permease protein
MLPLLLLTLGVAWFLAATGVFLRDVAHTTGILTSVLLFLSPVFYPITAVPEEWRPLMLANPLTFAIEQAREVLVWGRAPDLAGLGLYFVAALAVALLGLAWFQKTRRGFADVV